MNKAFTIILAIIFFMIPSTVFSTTQLSPDTKRPVTNKIILIHGLSGESSGWISMKDMLAEYGCEVVLFDLSGHGSSQQELSDVSWKDWARQVQEVIDTQSQDGKVSIFGHSMGGLLAYIVGNQDMDKVENIVTFGAAFQNISLKDKIIIYLSPILKYIKPTYEISSGHTIPLTTLRDFLYLNTSAKSVIKTNQIRSLALHGRQDTSVPVDEARFHLEGRPNISFKVLEQSHYPSSEDDFREIADQIRNFISPDSGTVCKEKL